MKILKQLFMILVWVNLLWIAKFAAGQNTLNICEGSTLTIKCLQDHHINVTSASYGRKDALICPISAGIIQLIKLCTSNVLNKVRSMCDGKSSCTLSATNDVFGNHCSMTNKYLSVTYTCSKVLAPSLPTASGSRPLINQTNAASVASTVQTLTDANTHINERSNVAVITAISAILLIILCISAALWWWRCRGCRLKQILIQQVEDTTNENPLAISEPHNYVYIERKVSNVDEEDGYIQPNPVFLVHSKDGDYVEMNPQLPSKAEVEYVTISANVESSQNNTPVYQNHF